MTNAKNDQVEWSKLKAHELCALASNNAVVILPLAAMEQHGPHLPVMVDTRIGYEIAVRAAQQAYPLRPTVAAPAVWHGLSEHHMSYGGTFSLDHDTFTAVIRCLLNNLARHGFKDVLLSNSHGGNIRAMQTAVDQLTLETGLTLVATTYASEAETAFAEILDEQPHVMHACEAETSMMLALEPELVDCCDLQALGTERGDGFLGAGVASYRWRPFQHMTANGVSGKPATATAAKGERLLDAAATALAGLITSPDTWAPARDLRNR